MNFMSDVFNEYLSRRLSEINLPGIRRKAGPVITISRVAGCSVQQVAKILSTKLNEINGENKWKIISKEILHQSAEELKLHPDRIKTIFKAKNHNIFDDIVNAFLSSDYNLEYKMRRTVINTIHRFAVEGYKIIIGRGSNIICSDIEDSLNVRIHAPLEWRIKRCMSEKNMTRSDALDFIEEIEKDRASFRKSIKGEKVKTEDFDLVINQEKFSNEEIADIIIKALLIKNIIKTTVK